MTGLDSNTGHEPLLLSDLPVAGSAGHLQGLEDGKGLVIHRTGTTVFQAFLNLTKAILGAGSFVLPYAFMNMGLWGGLATITLAAAVAYYTIRQLCACKATVAGHLQCPQEEVTYVSVARYALGPVGAVIIYGLMLLASMGVSAAYLVFIGSNLNSIWPQFSQALFIAWVLPLVIPMTWLNSFRYLSVTSLFGDFALVVGLAATLIYGFTETHIEPLSQYSQFKYDTYARSFGSVAFLFCVNFLVLPIESSMREPAKFRHSLLASFVTVVVSNGFFGFIGYLFFKEGTCSIVVLNLGSSTILDLVKICLCIDLLFSYAIVFAPGRQIIENSVLSDDDPRLTMKQCIIRLILVAITYGFAQIKQFGTITNITGGVSMTSLCFILPPLLTMILSPRVKQTWASIIVNVGVMIIGVFAVIITVYISIKDAVEGFKPEC